MYYDIEKLISYDALLNFVIGERGCGKTFAAKKFVLEDFFKTGNQFVYLRRYKTELDTSIQSFFSDLQSNNIFDDLQLNVKKGKKISEFTCDGETCGYAIPLSTANILKSTAFPKVKTIIFDEFLLDSKAGLYHYLRKEVEMLLDVVETIGRLRDIRVIFLGNAISVTNPYFDYFKISLPYENEFKVFKKGLIVVNYTKNLNYRIEKRKSKFGQLIEGTEYGDYAVENEFFRDNDIFVVKRPDHTVMFCKITINNKTYGVWQSKRSDNLYISEKFDPNCKRNFVVTAEDHFTETQLISARQNPYFKLIIAYFENAKLFFDSINIKNHFLPLLLKSYHL